MVLKNVQFSKKLTMRVIKYVFMVFLYGQFSDTFQGISNDKSGKYLQFDSIKTEHFNPDLPFWFGVLKESTLISLGGDTNLR